MKEAAISITTGTIVKTALIGIGLFFLYYLRELVLVVLTAVVIASACEPAVRFFMRARLPRLVAVIVLYLLIFTFLFGMFYLFLPTVLNDTQAFVAALPDYLQTVSTLVSLEDFAFLFGLAPGAAAGDVIAEINNSLNLATFFGSSFSAAASVVGSIFSLILILVFSFYFTVAETGVDDFLRIIAPKRYKSYLLNLWFRSRHKIGLWMQGQVLLGVIVGVLVYLSLTIIGVKHALLLAVLAAVLELIPVFGPTISAVPAVLIAFADGGVTMGLIVIALYIIIQQFENHLIYPLVVTKVVGVPPLLVILGLIIGWNIAGFLGILLSVPISAALQEFVNDWSKGKVFVEEGDAA